MKRHTRSLFVIAALSALLGGCMVNPATGKRQFSLISEPQEIQIGRENDRAITTQLGLYDDEGLQQYVQQLGSEIAASSERPHLEWTFRVVDDPVVNAFALPGGYIYITRGIMAHMNNEAELASVIGHEIGHVTGRHGVSQMSKQQLFQLGLGVSAVLAPEQFGEYGALAQAGLGLLFLKYGRDDERQADDLGLRYLVTAGYDPRPMTDMFDTLGRVSAAAGGERLPGWMSTHPLPENRQTRIARQIEQLGLDLASAPTNERTYQRRIENMVFGADPRQGYFRGGRFYHPQMRFQAEFPESWRHANQREAVIGVSESQDALVALTLAPEDSAQAALGAFLEQPGVTRKGAAPRTPRRLPSAGAVFDVATQSGAATGVTVFVEFDDQVFRLLGYTTSERWPELRTTLIRFCSEFGRLTDRRALDVKPARLRVVRVGESLTLEAFARRYDASVPVETLALINRLDPGERLRAGGAYKVVTGGELPD
ncbi:MAG: M48 family metalloprotease [bacterium]|nr:M48 family metalloprotease [bacterium]